MKPRELSSDALRLIIQIGGMLEQRVLDGAREVAAGRRSENIQASITTQDVRDALASLLGKDESGLRCLFDVQDSTRRDARQAG